MSCHKRYLLSSAHKKTNVKAILVSNVLVIVACSLLTTGVIASLYVWRTNQEASKHAEQLIDKSNNGVADGAPSTTKPTTRLIDNYVVAASLPRYLLIPKLNINAIIRPIGLLTNGSLGNPSNVYDTAWYDKSALPGQMGAMLIDGHISSWTTHGVFYGLRALNPGDIIDVRSGNGAIFTYHVVITKIYNSNDVDMAAATSSIIPGKPGLNLISCTGDVISGSNEFNERIIVYAVQT